jgi:antibiotic biosynthesis monooxygenase (ABM) superfamily enzyme
LITWVAVYPTITVALWALHPLIGHLPLPMQTLVVTICAVPVITGLGVPLLLRLNAYLSEPRR